MLQISIFTVVIIILIIHIILASLVNLMLRETEDINTAIWIIVFYLILLTLTFMYLNSIL